MKRQSILAGFAAIALAIVLPAPAAAGVYADDLGKCLVAQSSAEDKAVLMRWIFAVFGDNPALEGLSAVTDVQQAGYDKAVAAVFERILFVDCRKPALDAIRNEGGAALEASFGLLGQVAARELMRDPAALEALTRYMGYIDSTRFALFLAEAGIDSGKK